MPRGCGPATPLQVPRDEALAGWARSVTSDATRTTGEQLTALQAAGIDEDQAFAATVFFALRLAFATVSDVLGATPDDELRAAASDTVRRAVANRLR